MADAPVITLEVRREEAGMRLDSLVAARGLGLSRSQIEKLSKSGGVWVADRQARAGRRMEAGERVELRLPAPATESLTPQPVSLEIVFEDDHLLVIVKPQGMVVHPGAGRERETLAHALLARLPGLAVGPAHRPGIVHRLDRDTSGLMVVAKTEAAYLDLSRQVRERELERRYVALAWGRIAEDRVMIAVPIGRHLRDPRRMAAVPRAGAGRKLRPATTEVRVLERLGAMTLVEARIATGRTHQIRVHLAHLGHPVVGDRAYGLRRARQEKAGLDAETLAQVEGLKGQALHAQTLSFRHPATGQRLSFSTPLPRAMSELIARLQRRADAGGRGGVGGAVP